MSNDKVVSLTQVKEERQLELEDSINLQIAETFEDYLDYWMYQSEEDPENNMIEVAVANISERFSETFNPTKVLLLLQDEDRVAIAYSPEFRDCVLVNMVNDSEEIDFNE